jgi:NAD(P)-dependent dehydrogenase (short-subunit alcohol dehydrogenase family)
MCKEVGKQCMVPRRRGKVINVASVWGIVAQADPRRLAIASYHASKGGVISLTRALAAEWAQYDINVNALAPGLFPTKMTRKIIELMGDEAGHNAPLKRPGGPEDLKGALALFASAAGSYITGQTLAIDGGMTAV